MQMTRKMLKKVNIYSCTPAPGGYVGRKISPSLLGFVYAEVFPQKETLSSEMSGERTSRGNVMILRADAVKEQKILEATGEAQAIEMVQKALADSLVKLNEANPSERVLTLKSLEAFQKAADGRATKIIIPSEIQGLAGLAAGLKGIVEGDAPAPKKTAPAVKETPVYEAPAYEAPANDAPAYEIPSYESPADSVTF